MTTIAPPVCHEGGFKDRRVRRGTLLTLALGLGATALLFRWEWQKACAGVQEDLAHDVDGIVGALNERIQAHKQILRSGAAMAMASNHFSREDWHLFDQRQQLRITLPGIQGFGFAVMIPPNQLERHIQAIRAEGYPDYRVWPEGERSQYSAIIYLEPFAGRNLRAFGYDMFSEPVRCAAMQAACDDDRAALSGPVKLVQENGEDVQVGTLMYAPVYRRHAPIETVAERRAALVGWVYSPYRMDDLIRGILGRNGHGPQEQLRVQIFDGGKAEPAGLLFDSHRGHDLPVANDGMLQHETRIPAAGRLWLVRTWLSPSAVDPKQFKIAWVGFGAGGLLSTLMAGLVYSLLNTQCQARKQAARLTADLRQSEERWKLATEGSGIGVWDWDIPSGQVLFSLRWKEILGYAENEIGDHISEWESRIRPEDLGPTLQKVEAYLRGAAPGYDAEFRMRAKDGTWKWIHDAGLVVQRDAAGNPLRMVGTHTDITLAKLAAEELADTLERQRQIAAMKTRFISVTSHEFRTPMAAAMTAADLLINHAERITQAKRHELHDRIRISMRRMAEMLDEILTLNRIEEGRIRATPQTIDLRQLVMGTIEEIRLADQQTHAIELCAPASVQATVDPAILRHILSNLLSNATRYSAAGTTITVRIETGDAHIRLTIEDLGIGVPAADLQRIFEPFERGSNVGQIKGTGLGLSIVKRSIDLLKGGIDVQSVVDQGSRFTVTLPAQPEPAAAPL